MMRHMLLFRFRQNIDAATKARVLRSLKDLPSHYPAMKRFGLGENVSERDKTFTYVMTMEFERAEELHNYLKSDRHEHFVATQFKPNIDDRVIATYFASDEYHPGTTEDRE